ncbi:MAG: glutamate racemase [Vulcanimicrobiaceae bacterium]
MLRHVREQLPDEDVVYLADQAHVPYGDRSPDDLERLTRDNVAMLEAAGVDAIVMGCNTSCAVAARRGWPPTRVPILDLIVAAAEDVVGTGARRIGVLATTATASSGAYGAAIRALAADADVWEAGAPALVPLVEAGTLTGPVARAAVADALALFRAPLDTLVLACTHYPLLAAHFAALLPPAVRIVDPAVAQAARAAAFVRSRDNRRGRGRTRFLTTGPLPPFRHALVETFAVVRPSDTVDVATPVGARG